MLAAGGEGCARRLAARSAAGVTFAGRAGQGAASRDLAQRTPAVTSPPLSLSVVIRHPPPPPPPRPAVPAVFRRAETITSRSAERPARFPRHNAPRDDVRP